MPQTATLPTGGEGGGGFEGLSTPMKLVIIGGGAGLAFFLWRKMSSGGGNVDGGSSDNTFGIPNTAIMLGSMQQELLDLKGQVGSGDAQLSDLVTGGFENMGSQLDAQTAAIQSGLGTLQTTILASNDANTQSILGALQSQGDVLANLIAGNTAAIKAVNDSFNQSFVQGLDVITAQHNATLAAIGALGNNVSTGQQQIIGQLQTMEGQVSGINAQVGDTSSLIRQLQNTINLSSATAGLAAKNATLAQAFDGKIVWSNSDQAYYFSSGGHIYHLDWWWAIKHFDVDKSIRTDMSLTGSSDAWIGGDTY